MRAARPIVTAFFPYCPDAMNLVEDPNAQIEFRPPLGAGGVPTFAFQPNLSTDLGIRIHEHGHELERQLERAGDTIAALRTALWVRRGFPGTWEQQEQGANNGDYGAIGTLGWWAALPVEIVAESISRAILGAPWTERHMYSYMPIDHDAELLWWQDRFRARGVEVPAMRTFTFPLALTNGRADRIGGTAISLTEQQRAGLRLISGQGRKYAVDIQRVGLTGVETSLPDARGWVTEDSTVAIGASGRWKLSVMVRNDFGGEGWYEARFEDITAAV